MRQEVYCTLQIEGIHQWSACPFDEVGYLRSPHRHMFHIKAFKTVTHSDRDTEFIMLKHQISKHFAEHYPIDSVSSAHVFGNMSCEMIAIELIRTFDLSSCEVNEDGENGAIVWAE